MKTTAQKEEIFKRNEKLVNIIYSLTGGMVMHSQLINLAEELKIDTSRRIKMGILELIKGELVSKKQVLNTNNNMLVLTGYTIAKVEGIKSADAYEVATSVKSICDNIMRAELLINTLKLYRKKFNIKDELSVEHVQAVFNRINSTLCVPLRNINDYIQQLEDKYSSSLSQNFRDDLTVLKVNKALKINQLAKYNNVEIDPEDLRLKENYDDLKSMYGNRNLQEQFFNISSVKNSSCDIERFTVKNGRLEVILAAYQTRNGSLDRIVEIVAWFYKALQRYNVLMEEPILFVNVHLVDEEMTERYTEEAEQLAECNYGYRGATKVVEILKRCSVRFPECTDNIFWSFENLHITDYYNISF